MAVKNNNQKCLIRSMKIAPFLNNKLKLFLKEDKKKKKTDCSEFGGHFNPYVISLIRADLKTRNIL